MFRSPPRHAFGPRPSVLVVDDVDATRAGLVELLRLRGYVVREAGNGADAIASLREHPETSVVLLDVAMPGTDGYWFRDQQLQDGTLARVPVVVFTGSANREQLAKLRVNDLLIKPFSVDRVFEAIDRHCMA
jgi:CheY-like chemotaxis protein